jgi:hypothetical protein
MFYFTQYVEWQGMKCPIMKVIPRGGGMNFADPSKLPEETKFYVEVIGPKEGHLEEMRPSVLAMTAKELSALPSGAFKIEFDHEAADEEMEASGIEL